jgi:hypothetical protein
MQDAAGEVDDELVFTIAIEVADGAVIDRVAGRRANGNREVGADGGAGGDSGDRRRARRRLLAPAGENGADGVGIGFGGVEGGVGEERRGDEGRDVVFLGCGAVGGAVEVEGEVGGLGAKKAPGDDDLFFVGLEGDDTATKVFHLARRGCGEGVDADESKREQATGKGEHGGRLERQNESGGLSLRADGSDSSRSSSDPIAGDGGSGAS